MLKNYLFVVIRHFQKQKLTSFSNILGLTIAFVMCLFIFLFVFDELQYDSFNKNKKHIFRCILQESKTGERVANLPAAFFPLIQSSIPEISEGFRLYRQTGRLIVYREKKFLDDVYFADNAILNVLTLPLLRGNKKTALKDPFSVILTEKMASKYFGNENPLGKVLRFENKYDLKITGVLKDIPMHSSIQPSIIVSMSTLNTINPDLMKKSYIRSSMLYFLLKKNTSIKATEEKLIKLIRENAPKLSDGYDIKEYANAKIVLEPLSKIYLYSPDVKWDIARHGDINTVVVFITIALLIMVMAAFNFTNLFTTLVKVRQKEYSIRKLLGAGRKNTIKQFLLETFFYLFVSLAAAFIIVDLLLNVFNQITGKTLTFASVFQWEIIASVAGLLLAVAIFSIIYPIYVTFRSSSPNNLKGNAPTQDIKLSKMTFGFRQTVTAIQFAITVILIFASVIIYEQMLFMINGKLGFNKEHLLVVQNSWGRNMYVRYQNFKNEISSLPEVLSVSAGENVPGENINNYTSVRISGRPVTENIQCAQIAVDYGLFKTWQVKFLAGRDFSKEIAPDASQAVIINKAAAEKLGLKNAVGAKLDGLNNSSDRQRVIGVVENIHFKSFKEKIMPIVFYLRQWSSSNIVVRLKSDKILSTIKVLEKDWENVDPVRPFDYSFVDQAFTRLYTSEKRTETLVMIFCSLAIMISFIGLLSLITLVAQMRRKEIGIRKVLGASALNVTSMIMREFIYIILVAELIAFPMTYYFLNKWLQGFAYRINLNWWVFVLSGGIALVIALFTVSIQAIKAATANPIKSLRYE